MMSRDRNSCVPFVAVMEDPMMILDGGLPPSSHYIQQYASAVIHFPPPNLHLRKYNSKQNIQTLLRV